MAIKAEKITHHQSELSRCNKLNSAVISIISGQHSQHNKVNFKKYFSKKYEPTNLQMQCIVNLIYAKVSIYVVTRNNRFRQKNFME